MHFKTLILSTLAAVGLTTGALAGDVSWDGEGDDLTWSDEENWSGDALPTLNDRVTISGSGNPIDVDIADAKAGVLVLNARGLDVLAGKQLEIDGNYSGGSQSSSIASGVTIDLEGDDSDLKFSGSTTLEGDGKVVGMHNGAHVEIPSGVTLTLTATVEGQLDVTAEALSGGTFLNNGVIEAKGQDGVLLVNSRISLGAGSGDWKVSKSGAKLQFDSGSTSESGDFVISAGEMEFNNEAVSTTGKVRFLAGVMDVNENFTTTLATDSFEYDGGTFEIASGKRFQYQDYDDANSSQSDPDDDPPADTDPPYEVVN